MQMYRVKFAYSVHADGTIDRGDVAVCASSREAAITMTAQILELPISATEFDVARVKPGLLQISRRVESRRLATWDADAVPDAVACRATFPGRTESREDRKWHAIRVDAEISAVSDSEAIMMLSRSLARKMTGERQKRSTRELTITCDPMLGDEKISSTEKQSIYTAHQFFSGGAGRPR